MQFYLTRVPRQIRDFSILRRFATAASSSASNPAPLVPYRTGSDPNSFTQQHIGQWYTVPVAHLEKLSYKKSLPAHYARQVETLLECSIMIRRPFVDVLNCLRQHNPDTPVIRYVIYGAFGTGKSMTLWQAVHWAHANGWIVCFVPFARYWNRVRTEVTQSTWRPDRFDLPIFATEWLARFKIMNEDLMKQYQLFTHKDYTWTARENTPAGSPLISIVDLGINRPKLASDCMGALLRELKLLAREKKTKVMVAIDMVNSFFVQTRYRRPDGNYMHSSELSIVRHMTKFCAGDWNSGAVVTTVDNREIGTHLRPPHWPYHLLGQEGFETLDPFIPIETPDYTDHEASSCLDYYIEKNWLQRPSAKTEEGRLEIIHISARNPFLLERTIAAH